MRRPGFSIVLVSTLAVAGCNQNQNGTGTTSPSRPTQATAADLAYCVQDVNRYRASVGRPAYSESPALEAYAAAGAQQDGTAGTAHAHFASTNGGGVALAENEFLRQGLTGAETVQMAIQIADAVFFGEGPGGGHYENMTSTSYTTAGCGVFIQNDAITIVEDFR